MRTKGDLVEAIYNSGDGTKAEVGRSVSAVLDGIAQALEDDGEVRLAGFGTFKVKERAARNGRNPHTGEAIKIAARNAVTFKPATALKERVQ